MSGRSASVQADGLLREYRKRYPDALAVCGRLLDDARSDRVTWTDWCWLPMAAVHAYLSSRVINPGEDLARVAALTAWRLGRGVYVPELDVAEYAVHELRSQGRLDAASWNRAVLPPLEAWTRLPEWCCYLSWPVDFSPPVAFDPVFSPAGVFVHLEQDANTARPELRLLLDTDGTWTGLIPIPIYLDRRNLGSALADMTAVARASAQGAVGADVRAVGPLNVETSIGGLLAWNVLPLVLTLIDPHSRFVDPAEPEAAPRPAQRQDGGWRPAPTTRTWTVTYRIPGPHLRLLHPRG
jgi:hypothetical protein